MSLDQTQNFVRATIASAVDSADTTIDVTDSNQLPDPAEGEYNLILWDVDTYPRPGQDPNVEVVRATALDESADELSVDRGQENTAAADHPETAVLQLSPTAKMFADIDAQKLGDGQNFDGQNESEFQNVKSLGVERLETDWIVDAQKHTSLQNAISHAGETGAAIVKLGGNTYEEEVIVDEQVVLMGSTSRKSVIIGETSDFVVDIAKRGSKIVGVEVRNEGGGGHMRTTRSCIVRECLTPGASGSDGVLINGDECRVMGCDLAGGDITIDAGDNAIIGNVRVGTIDDQGTGNETVGNT